MLTDRTCPLLPLPRRLLSSWTGAWKRPTRTVEPRMRAGEPSSSRMASPGKSGGPAPLPRADSAQKRCLKLVKAAAHRGLAPRPMLTEWIRRLHEEVKPLICRKAFEELVDGINEETSEIDCGSCFRCNHYSHGQTTDMFSTHWHSDFPQGDRKSCRMCRCTDA